MSSGRVEPSNDPPPTSSGQHVLMKDQTKIKKALRKTTIIVNSRDRNLVANASSSDFRITFRRPLTNIMSVELLDGCVPIELYTIDESWNKFILQEGTTKFTVIIPIGIYTEATLVTGLQTAMNTTTGVTNTYTVTQDPITRKITIVGSTVAFALLFYSGQYHDEIDYKTAAILSINSPARQLGFGLNDYVSNAARTIVAPIPMDLDNFLNRMYIHINDSNNQSLHRMEMSNGRQDCFHMLVYQPNAQPYLFLDKQMDMPIYESSPVPIARMSGLQISFRDEFNRVMNFRGKEVNLVLEFTHLE